MAKGFFNMEWVMIYLEGKPGFIDEVVENLDRSKVRYMSGAPESESLYLFWIDEKLSLRDFKKAIGSKTVFKYRLCFFSSIEHYLESKKSNKEIVFTPREQELSTEYLRKVPGINHYKYSA